MCDIFLLGISLSLSLTHTHTRTLVSSSNTVIEIISISDPQVSGNEISAVCEVVGYPSPSIQWEDSSGNEITSNIRTNIVSNTYETTISATITVDRFDCRGPYSCSARNTNAQSRMTTELSTDLCSGELQCTCLCGCVCVCVHEYKIVCRA